MNLKKIFAMILVIAMCVMSVAFAAGNEEDWTNILLMGTDARSNKKYTLSDSMMILSMNSETHQVKLTSIMRDTWVVDPVTGKHQKLTELCPLGQGPDRTIAAINRDFGMNIEKYVLVNMRSLATIVDLVGGVDVAVSAKERNRINQSLKNYSELSGMEKLQSSGDKVHLNGNQALAFARIRKMDSDYIRVQRQRNVLLDMAKSLKAQLTPTTMVKVVNSLMNYIDTNLNLADILNIATFAMDVDIDKVEQFRIPVDGTYQDGMFGNTWCIKPDFEANAKLLHEFIYE